MPGRLALVAILIVIVSAAPPSTVRAQQDLQSDIRLSFVSRARYSSPIPPAPSGATISYGPSVVPVARLIDNTPPKSRGPRRGRRRSHTGRVESRRIGAWSGRASWGAADSAE
jgi:hypothetical protein